MSYKGCVLNKSLLQDAVWPGIIILKQNCGPSPRYPWGSWNYPGWKLELRLPLSVTVIKPLSLQNNSKW
eukprot:scaffold79909_cov47-Prasinocladus_malaysianus.AAC.4